MLTIRQADTNEFTSVVAFYHELIDEMETATYKPGWKKGVYPSDNLLQTSINKALRDNVWKVKRE